MSLRSPHSVLLADRRGGGRCEVFWCGLTRHRVPCSSAVYRRPPPLYAPRFWATQAVLLPTKSYLATNTSLPFSVVFSALMVPVISSPVTVSTPSA